VDFALQDPVPRISRPSHSSSSKIPYTIEPKEPLIIIFTIILCISKKEKVLLIKPYMQPGYGGASPAT
jgi:hypothetical protein